jgi:prepilin-type N-terminal cleavage/methylation domain-containing protein
MKRWTKNGGGFTIVELLIVIVMIAILAAITIVAYNGIQTRAENTKTVQAVGEYVKIISSYAAAYGNYPVEPAFPCLSEAGTTCSRVSGSGTCWGAGNTGSNTNFITELKKIATTLPSTSPQRLTCAGNEYMGAYITPTSGKTMQVRYFLKGDQVCGGIGGLSDFVKQQQDNVTYCGAVMATLP